jgi:hypothetical protein
MQLEKPTFYPLLTAMTTLSQHARILASNATQTDMPLHKTPEFFYIYRNSVAEPLNYLNYTIYFYVTHKLTHSEELQQAV